MAEPGWALGPFSRIPGSILGADASLHFKCPVSGRSVAWAEKDVFNPAAIVRDGRVHLLVRAEDRVGRYSGTSRIGLAVSDDGVHFALEPEPVIHPDDDAWQAWEWPGGCEDPRVVERPEGGFVCLYTAFDGKNPTLFVATSDDLREWVKHGPAFAGTPLVKAASKSGSVVTELVAGRPVASLLDGRFWMYWGEGHCFAATSDDLIRWSPVDYDAAGDRWLSFDRRSGSWNTQSIRGARYPRPLLSPRAHRFDSLLVEPGPPAIVTDDGILLVYNGANHPKRGDPATPAYAYQPGQALFDRLDPSACIARCTEPSVPPASGAEQAGQVDHVSFGEGLVFHQGQVLLYLGSADSRIGLATCALPPWAQTRVEPAGTVREQR